MVEEKNEPQVMGVQGDATPSGCAPDPASPWGSEILKNYYLGHIEESKEILQIKNQLVAALNGVRERYPQNWKIVEAARELIFYCQKDIESEMKEIEATRESIRQLSRV